MQGIDLLTWLADNFTDRNILVNQRNINSLHIQPPIQPEQCSSLNEGGL